MTRKVVKCIKRKKEIVAFMRGSYIREKLFREDFNVNFYILEHVMK